MMPKPVTGLIAYVVVRKRLVNIKLDYAVACGKPMTSKEGFQLTQYDEAPFFVKFSKLAAPRIHS